MRPVLFYTVGYPGAGKTTLARSLSCWLQTEHLRGDKIGLELFRFPTFSYQERQMVFSEMAKRAARTLATGKHVVWDAATNTRAQRDYLAKLAAQFDSVAVGIWIEVPTELAKERAGTARSDGAVGRVVRVIPPHIFDQYVAAFETPAADEPIVRVSGSAPFALQYRRIKRQLHLETPGSMPRLIQ
jgi:predicted kinase